MSYYFYLPVTPTKFVVVVTTVDLQVCFRERTGPRGAVVLRILQSHNAITRPQCSRHSLVCHHYGTHALLQPHRQLPALGDAVGRLALQRVQALQEVPDAVDVVQVGLHVEGGLVRLHAGGVAPEVHALEVLRHPLLVRLPLRPPLGGPRLLLRPLLLLRLTLRDALELADDLQVFLQVNLPAGLVTHGGSGWCSVWFVVLGVLGGAGSGWCSVCSVGTRGGLTAVAFVVSGGAAAAGTGTSPGPGPGSGREGAPSDAPRAGRWSCLVPGAGPRAWRRAPRAARGPGVQAALAAAAH
mmetsp:Transcript_1229/g.2850  ORF Transcript_1229/g.2850 Transcript_1229/m.2850 type:complete len:297 (+) Transcript_1229:155-1045(+)